MPAPSPAVVRAAAFDVIAIVAFAAAGRRSHDETGSAVAGAIEVAAPFLIALAIGWSATRAWRRPAAVVTGIAVWAVTVVAGMVLRRLVFDRGVAASFIVVATIVTGLLLVGWRAVLALLERRRPGSV